MTNKKSAPESEALSKQIRIELAERDMTQAQLADLIGVGRVVMNRYLNGKSTFDAGQLFQIAQVFEMNLSELLRRSEARLPQ